MANLNHLFNHRDSFGKEQERDGVCDWCGCFIVRGHPVYRCSNHGCRFKLHEWCQDRPNEMADYHLFNHRDSLVFIEEQKHYGVRESVSYCDLCHLPIFTGTPLYSCRSRGCEFKVHKWCRDLPGEITGHSLHPHHPLTLYLDDKYPISCDACNIVSGDFGYECKLCRFYLHVDCAAALIKHPSHQMKHPSHQHPLTPLQVPASFHCSGCGRRHRDGLSYQCTTCHRFWVHQDCAVLPATIESPHLHGHPLTLEYAFPKEYSRFEYPCNICGDIIKMYRWLYSCGGCRYFAHVKCAIRKLNTTTQVADESSWNIGDFLKKMELCDDTKIKNDDKEIEHFSHDHSLILLNDQNEKASNSKLINHKTMAITTTTTSGDRRFCSGCLQIILKSTPFYGCVLCDYFLHKNCAFLPTELQNHPFHPEHPLVLLPEGPNSFGVFDCKVCERRCNRFTYGCKNCNYYLDLKCASLSSSITHKAHSPNHLLRINKSVKKCNACGYYEYYTYQCESCNFHIDKACAQLPHTIEHRYDKHPFELTYHPLPDHPSEYFCEICEKELNPNKWFYHCVECDQSIHPFCYFDTKANLKYGATINTELHPHPLAFVKPEWKSTCDSCGKSICWPHDVGIFECVQCVKFKIHSHCVELRKLEESKEKDNDRVDR